MAKKLGNIPETSPQLKVNVGDLVLDVTNPRLSERSVSNPSQDEIVRTLWDEMAVDEIAWSIAKNGYFQHEPLIVEKRKDGKYLVIEGNRRLAAVKLLLNDTLRKKIGATELPTIDSKRRAEISELPVIVGLRQDVWPYVGFKHVNGPQPWESFSKAAYIARVHNDIKVSLDTIAERIGDKHSTVKRLYRGWMVLEQAENTAGFDRTDRSRRRFAFSHLYTGLDYAGFQKFIGIGKDGGLKPNPVPSNKLGNLRELLVWLYGSSSAKQEPIVRSQNPDLKNLDEVLLSKDGISALRGGLALKTSLDISRGDQRVLREFLIIAKQSLQDGLGKLPTGFQGEADLVELGREIAVLATTIVEQMQASPKKSGATKKGV